MNRLFYVFFTLISLSFLQTGFLSAQTLGPSGFRVGFVKVRIQSQADVKLVAGQIGSLSKITKVHIIYDRDSTKVCDYDSEAAYLEHRCKDKDSAAAEAIRQKWAYMHKEVCEPNFEDYFNRNANKVGISGFNNPNEKLPVLLVRMRMEEPHQHTGGWTSPPYVVAECSFFDASGNELAVFELSAVGSSKGDNTERMRDCYAIAGKLLSKEIVKRMEN